MSELAQSLSDCQVRCKICGQSSEFFDEGTVLRKHSIRYFRCADCGFIQTEEPYWLEEAYSSAITASDVGIIERNLINRNLTAGVLTVLLPAARRCVDFGGGHGIFVRMMRDKGFDFLWRDLYASNDYARGFEYRNGESCDFLTSFEVLEHLVDPLEELSTMMALSDNVFVSTLPLPDPPPRLSEWWYYVPSTGQHISFYTPKSLQAVARRFGRHLLSHGGYHLFTKRPINRLLFRVAMSYKASLILRPLSRRRGLIESDFELFTK